MTLAHLRGFVPVLAAYFPIAATQYAYFGDRMGYAQNIVRFDRDHAAATQDFWGFGHLLMMPSGWLLYRLIAGPSLAGIGRGFSPRHCADDRRQYLHRSLVRLNVGSKENRCSDRG